MKEKFIKSTLILLIGGLFTKILGMLIKIVMARIIGSNGLGMYMLIIPTFILLINLSQFGFPIALSKLVSEDKRNNKKLFFSIIPVIILINIIIIIAVVMLAPYISNNLLHNKETYISIIAMATVIPFTTISSICRSYFFGKEKMIPHVTSNIIEDLVRLVIIIKITPLVIPYGLKYTTCFLVLINIVSEIVSTVVLIFFIPKNILIKKSDLIPNKYYIKDSLKIGIPNTVSRLIGSIGYFLEPIILTSVLLRVGYNSNFITKEYGIINGFVIPLILLPSFFTLAISQALLPVISKEYVNNNIKSARRKLRIAITLSLIIGMPVTLLLSIYPSFFLKLIYKTTEGVSYIKVLAPVCIFQYIQSPLSYCLDAMGKSKDNLIATSIGTTIRTIILFIFSSFRIGLWSLVIATASSILATSFYQIKKVRKYLT